MYKKLITFLIIAVGLLSAQQVTVSTIHLTSPLSLDGLIVADDGTLYGAEGYDGSRIFKINMDGTSEVFASNLNGPIDMDFDNEGNLYVTTFNNRGVYKITPSRAVSKFATVNTGPSGIVLNRETGDVFVSHFGNAPYSGHSVYKIDSSGTVTTFIQDAQLKSPVSLAIDNNTNLYTPNIGDAKLFKITQDGSMSLLSALPVSNALYNIGHIEFANGKLYLTGNTGRNYLYEVELDGTYKIIAGTGIAGSQDGEGPSAKLNGPNGIAASVTGDTLFISELNNPSSIRVVTFGSSTGVEDKSDRVKEFNLMQNFPNPFNPSTTIRFNMVVPGQIRLTIYNLLGKEIRVLENNYLPAGRHQAAWNGTDNKGGKVSSGIYYYSLEMGDTRLMRKLLLIK